MVFGIRIWHNKRMIYPEKFSVKIDYEKRISSFRTYQGKEKIEVTNPMFLTCGIARNGEIYELDILSDSQGNMGLVRYDSEKGYFFVEINRKRIFIYEDMSDYEVVGNLYEDKGTFKKIGKEKKKASASTNKKEVPADKKLIDVEINTEEPPEDLNLDLIVEDTIITEDAFVYIEPREILFDDIDLKNIDIFLYSLEGKKSIASSYIMQFEDFEKLDTSKVNKKNANRLLSEIEILINSLESIHERCSLKIRTSNKYLIAPFEQGWIDSWDKNDWRKTNGDRVKGYKEWKQLYGLLSRHEYKIIFVPPGSSLVELIRCEEMCREVLADE